jgi:hypothetical protein
MKKLVILTASMLATTGVLAMAAYAATGWTVVSVPSTSNNVILLGASARTNSDAWAVGQQFVAAGQPQAPAVAYHWAGASWSLTPTPNLGEYGALRSVSASSATDAWAVGFTQIGRRDDGTLIEHWNGSAWSVSSKDAITGYAAGLTGVVDLSPDDAWAVGDQNSGGLIEQWNGLTWSPVALPDPAFTPSSTNPISADSPTDIWVVGSSINLTTDATIPEALHFTGAGWSVVPLAQPAGQASATIQSVTAISPTNAWAVGEYTGTTSAVGGSTLIEQWTGSAWKIVPSPTPGAYPSLSGVAARSANDVYAVGTNLPSVNGGPEQGMILRWNGSAWTVDSSGVFTGELFAAATFPGAANEWAVGVNGGNQGLVLSHG